MIEICNLRNEKAKNAYDVVVCRGKSVLGNPFTLLSETDRDYVCDRYREWFNEQIIDSKAVLDELIRLHGVWKNYGKLRLFCWCAPKRCHAETIKRWLEEYEP
jgi:hypothetical protein